MRTTAILRPPVLGLPPPLDARVLRLSCARTPRPRYVTAILHTPAVVLIVRVVRVVVRWLRSVITIPAGRRLTTTRARCPPA